MSLISSAASPETSPPKRTSVGLLSACEARFPVKSARHVGGQCPLRDPPVWLTCRSALELFDVRGAEQGEELEVPDGILVVGVQPELIEAIGRRERGIEPDCPVLGLAELVAPRRRQ